MSVVLGANGSIDDVIIGTNGSIDDVIIGTVWGVLRWLLLHEGLVWVSPPIEQSGLRFKVEV